MTSGQALVNPSTGVTEKVTNKAHSQRPIVVEFRVKVSTNLALSVTTDKCRRKQVGGEARA